MAPCRVPRPTADMDSVRPFPQRTFGGGDFPSRVSTGKTMDSFSGPARWWWRLCAGAGGGTLGWAPWSTISQPGFNGQRKSMHLQDPTAVHTAVRMWWWKEILFILETNGSERISLRLFKSLVVVPAPGLN
jgi:hypothetical protein